MSDLPVLANSENPSLLAGITPAVSLTGVVTSPQALVRTTHREAMLRFPSYKLPTGTAVTLIGRDLRLSYVYIQAGEVEGWVSYWLLEVEGDAHRLPIMYVNEN